MCKEIEVDTLTQFIAGFMYGNYDQVLVEFPTGKRVKVIDMQLSVLDGIKVKFIKGVSFDVDAKMYVIEVE